MTSGWTLHILSQARPPPFPGRFPGAPALPQHPVCFPDLFVALLLPGERRFHESRGFGLFVLFCVIYPAPVMVGHRGGAPEDSLNEQNNRKQNI